MELNAQTIKKIVREELPGLMKRDKEIRQFIWQLTREPLAEMNEKTDRLETKMESRFDLLLDELRKDREEQNRKWNEQNQKWDEQNRKWEENQKEIRHIYQSIEKLFKRYDSGIGALGTRWGLRSEASFRNALKGILKDLDLEVIHVDEYDDEGEVFGRPDNIELDIIILNGKLLICELKSSTSKPDMYSFYKKAAFYEKRHKRKADRLIIISPMVVPKAVEVAKTLGITIYSYPEEMEAELRDEDGVKSCINTFC